MNGEIKLNFGAHVMSVNDKGEPGFESSGSARTSITNEEMEKMIFEAKSFEEVYENLRASGVYLTMTESKAVIMPVNNGTVIFYNDGQVQDKITLDKELSPDVALQIEAAQNRDEIEEILVANKIIERPEKETEREVYRDGRAELVDEAEVVDERDVRNNSAIDLNRYARYNDPERRRTREIDGLDR